jgi:hypothetical protein
MDSSICSAVGWVPDALLVTVEAAMAWRRAVVKAVEKAVKKAVEKAVLTAAEATAAEATAAEATAGRHTLRTLTQDRRRLRGTSYRRR